MTVTWRPTEASLFGYVPVSATGDARTLVVNGPGLQGRSAVHIVSLASGSAKLAYEDDRDTAASSVGGALSPDGRRVAFTRSSDTLTSGRLDEGIWTQVVGAVSPTQLVASEPPTFTRALAWSDDGEWLAFTRSSAGSGSRLYLVRASGGAPRFVGPGKSVDWRGREPKLLVASSPDMFGSDPSELYTVDLTGGARRAITTSAAFSPRWHPSLDRVVYVSGSPAGVWMQDLGGGAVSIAMSRFSVAAWWSRDGAEVFALFGGDDSTAPIVGLVQRRPGARLCWRGPGPVCN